MANAATSKMTIKPTKPPAALSTKPLSVSMRDSSNSANLSNRSRLLPDRDLSTNKAVVEVDDVAKVAGPVSRRSRGAVAVKDRTRSVVVPPALKADAECATKKETVTRRERVRIVSVAD